MSESKRVLYMVCDDESLIPRYQQMADAIEPDTWIARGNRNELEPKDSGIDLFTPITNVCPPGITTTIDLGIKVSAYDELCVKHQPSYAPLHTMATPLALFLIVRSSTGKKTPLRQANAPGLIDQGYRGHLMAVVDNTSDTPFRAVEGERLFQIMACDGIPFDEVHLVDALSATERSTGGFGSTGK